MGVFAGPNIGEDGLVLCLDAGNGKSYQQNEHPNPLDIYGWYTTIRGDSNANVCTITRDTTTASPVGNEPLKMVVTGTDPYLVSYNSSPWNLAPASQGETWVASVYVKASTNTSIQLYIFGGNSSGGAFSPTDYSASTINVTTEWKRYSHYHTFAQSATQYVQVRLDGPDTQAGGDASGQEIWWDGIQVERVPSGTTTPGRFNSNSKTFEDLSGRGNNGTLVNSPRRNFDNGGSLVFDGVDDNITIPYNSNLKPTTTITMEAFCYIQNNGGSWTSLIQYPQNSSSHISPFFDWAIYLNMSGRYLHTRIDGEAASSANNVWNFNEWTYLAITFENQSVKYYVNGSNVGSSSITKTSIVYDANNPVYIGKNASGTEQLNGRIGSIKVYNKALTSQEIQQNFNALRGRFGI